ncbi:uncharacterized protein LOC142540489 isoform X1 [Primulina tabacum]|uniref:uncharacterized protein LOC142540489 isoform X1 n=1 Tax=Primulina tabacum TaxID=48773 RepID=UPI003F595344
MLTGYRHPNAFDKDMAIQAIRLEDISLRGSAEDNKKEVSELKRKNVKCSVISEKEFLKFTLKYQQVIVERDSAIAVRNKLESLCRELQQQNKMLMDECKRVSSDGQNLRVDRSNKFPDAIKLKQKTLELQLADLKHQQQEEKLKQEQSQMKLYAEQVAQLLETEKNLRLQFTADGGKFQQFQEALKSNEVLKVLSKKLRGYKSVPCLNVKDISQHYGYFFFFVKQIVVILDVSILEPRWRNR